MARFRILEIIHNQGGTIISNQHTKAFISKRQNNQRNNLVSKPVPFNSKILSNNANTITPPPQPLYIELFEATHAALMKFHSGKKNRENKVDEMKKNDKALIADT